MRLTGLVCAALLALPVSAKALTLDPIPVEAGVAFLEVAGFAPDAMIEITASYDTAGPVFWFGDAGIGDDAWYNYTQFSFLVTDVVSGRTLTFEAEPTTWVFPQFSAAPGVYLFNGQCGAVSPADFVSIDTGATDQPQGGGLSLRRMRIEANGPCDTMNWNLEPLIDIRPFGDVSLLLTVADASGRTATVGTDVAPAIPLPATLPLLAAGAAAFGWLRGRRRAG